MKTIGLFARCFVAASFIAGFRGLHGGVHGDVGNRRDMGANLSERVSERSGLRME